jgi:hypothetical protein
MRRALTHWLETHPRVPCQLLIDRRGGSRGQRRNLAADFARSPSLLVVDPGDEIAPSQVTRLLSTLAQVPVEFVYGQVAVERHPGAPFGAASARDWSETRVAQRSFITTPYVIRRESLARLGGFGEEPELGGSEEHDLFRRAAALGFSGRRVPGVIARTAGAGPVEQLPDGNAAALIADRAQAAALLAR